ncbi:chorismate mutase [Streptomyces sp. WZ-12]|uniref:chorismate mutase n=1 Tax=Streptomyces sp. WZ-12 TaxID=3030210 RepID=UPI002380CB6A|nr:chorismate mutase [Streptomyces sp. WZ-12]
MSDGNIPTAQAPAAPDLDQEIDRHRRRIDELDAQLATLFHQRRAHSRRIQDLRTDAARDRLDGRREERVRARYRAALGADGDQLAAAILWLCRGGEPGDWTRPGAAGKERTAHANGPEVKSGPHL